MPFPCKSLLSTLVSRGRGVGFVCSGAVRCWYRVLKLKGLQASVAERTAPRLLLLEFLLARSQQYVTRETGEGFRSLLSVLIKDAVVIVIFAHSFHTGFCLKRPGVGL